MSIWLNPSQLLSAGTSRTATNSRQRADGFWHNLLVRSGQLAQILPCPQTARLPLRAENPINLAAGVLACWQRGWIAELSFDPKDKHAFDCDQPLSNEIAKPLPQTACEPESGALAIGKTGLVHTFAQVDTDMLTLERTLGAWCNLWPRIGARPLQTLTDFYLRVLWPLCLHIPVQKTSQSWRGIATMKLPRVFCTTPAGLTALTAADFEHVSAPLSLAILVSADEQPTPVAPDWAANLACPPAVIGLNPNRNLNVLAPATREPKCTALEPQHYHLQAPADSLYFQGHFHGTPVLPGIAQLVWLTDILQDHLGTTVDIAQLEAVKFNQVVFPNESFTLQLDHDAQRNKWRFHILGDRGKLASGRLAVRSKAAKGEGSCSEN